MLGEVTHILSHKLEWKRDGNGNDKKMHVINCSGCLGSFYVDDYVKQYGKDQFPGRKIYLIRVGTDLVGDRFYLNTKPLSDSAY